MSDPDFGDPVAVAEMPEASAKGGRKSNEPALVAWLDKVKAAKPGTYELHSAAEDAAHPVSRATQLRKLAPENVKIETRPVVPGKRYRVFATVSANGPTK